MENRANAGAWPFNLDSTFQAFRDVTDAKWATGDVVRCVADGEIVSVSDNDERETFTILQLVMLVLGYSCSTISLRKPTDSVPLEAANLSASPAIIGEVH